MKIKFLIIRFSSIGDIVLTTPAVRCLKQQVEGAEIHYLTKKSFAGLVSSNPYIDKVYILKDDINETIKELKEDPPDYIIDLHNNLRTFRIKSNLSIAAFKFNKLNIEKWLMVNFKVNTLPKVHIVDRYLDTIRYFDVQNDENGLDYFIPEKDEVLLSTLPENFHKGYIGFVIGAKHETKKLPLDKIIEICKKVNFPILLLGGPEDKENGDCIQRTRKGSILNTCGLYNLNQSASLVKQATAIISHDTGLMHIASAFKKKIVSVWGNTIPEFGMYPYLSDPNSKMFEIKGLSCRPCSKIGFMRCPKKHFKCMKEQNVDDISAYLNQIVMTQAL